jgi:hypothetical protein
LCVAGSTPLHPVSVNSSREFASWKTLVPICALRRVVQKSARRDLPERPFGLLEFPPARGVPERRPRGRGPRPLLQDSRTRRTGRRAAHEDGRVAGTGS